VCAVVESRFYDHLWSNDVQLTFQLGYVLQRLRQRQSRSAVRQQYVSSISAVHTQNAHISRRVGQQNHSSGNVCAETP
jgi:hypothetical protein